MVEYLSDCPMMVGIRQALTDVTGIDHPEWLFPTSESLVRAMQEAMPPPGLFLPCAFPLALEAMRRFIGHPLVERLLTDGQTVESACQEILLAIGRADREYVRAVTDKIAEARRTANQKT